MFMGIACSREGNLAYLWERSIWREIVLSRMDSLGGIQSSVNCSPLPVSLKLPRTFPSGVGVSMTTMNMVAAVLLPWTIPALLITTMVGIMVRVDWGAMVGGWY